MQGRKQVQYVKVDIEKIAFPAKLFIDQSFLFSIVLARKRYEEGTKVVSI